jgi:hypothetical protein
MPSRELLRCSDTASAVRVFPSPGEPLDCKSVRVRNVGTATILQEYGETPPLPCDEVTKSKTRLSTSASLCKAIVTSLCYSKIVT